jgi:hypothetical protein
MSEDEKGKHFLELIDQQNTIQWKILTKLSLLVESNWNSLQLRQELELLIEKHSAITKELNNLDTNTKNL